MTDLIKREDAIKAVCKLVRGILADDKPIEIKESADYLYANIVKPLRNIPAVERNCFTCGIVDGQMIFKPEEVSEEVLKANDRAVSLAEVCKIIQEEYEVCPATWERFRNLSAVESKRGKWIPCEERMPSDRKPKLVYLSSDRITIASYNEHIMSLAPYKPIGWGYDKYHMIDFEKEEVIAWMPLPPSYKRGEDNDQ